MNSIATMLEIVSVGVARSFKKPAAPTLPLAISIRTSVSSKFTRRTDPANRDAKR